MTALAANKHVLTRPRQQCETGVKAAAKIYAGALIAIVAASGLCVPGDDTAGYVLPGLALNAADNTDGEDGDLNVLVQRGCAARVKYTGTAPKPGQTVYLEDDATVALNTTNNVCPMVVQEVFTATTECEVWIPEASTENALEGSAPGQKLFTGQAAVTGTLAVVTGLASISAFGVSLNENAALTGDRVTATAAAGTLTIAVWKPTAADDCTPIAADTAKSVSWWARGKV